MQLNKIVVPGQEILKINEKDLLIPHLFWHVLQCCCVACRKAHERERMENLSGEDVFSVFFCVQSTETLPACNKLVKVINYWAYAFPKARNSATVQKFFRRGFWWGAVLVSRCNNQRRQQGVLCKWNTDTQHMWRKELSAHANINPSREQQQMHSEWYGNGCM